MNFKQGIDLKHRIQQSVFEDGLTELMIGAYLFLLGWIIQINTYLVVFSVFLIFLMNPLFEKAKKRYIYPRAGFVKLPRSKGDRSQGHSLACSDHDCGHCAGNIPLPLCRRA